MYLEHFHLNRSPFAEEIDPDIFFPDAGRAEALAAMLAEIQEGKALVKLIGREGSGKTLLCRLVAKRLVEDEFDVVYLDNPVGSFDDLLHGVCLDLGISPTADAEVNMFSVMRTSLLQRMKNGRRVLLIIDEAEKLFLAALERLMRSICEMGEDHLLQVLLAGRPVLDVNLDQLTVYCSDVNIKGGGVLEPLQPEEVGHYLRFRLESVGLSPGNQDEVFTEGAVSKIAQSSKGNLRLINILAEEALQTSSSDKSFLVLLDHVATQEEPGEIADRGISSLLDALIRYKKVFVGACFLLVAFFAFTFFSNRNKQESSPPPVVEQVESKVNLPVESVSSPVKLDSPEEVEVPARYSDPPEVQVKEVIQDPPAEPVVVDEQPPVETEEDTVIELRPARIKVAPYSDKVVEKRPVVVAERVESIEKKKCPSASVQALSGSTTRISGEQLYQERIRASAKWLAGGYHSEYTVQLMMLASEQASTSIKKMLAQEDYCAIKNNLYILRKKTAPQTLFIFYGTYDSMEQARQARNNMPLFLRKHHPYALSINAAMKKTED